MSRSTVLVIGLVCASATSRADTSFGAGSIIVPVTAPYQTDCGSVSAYGFVYNILRANAWLAANGHGTIEVYYAYKESKSSPNRCTPTNRLAGPSYPGKSSPAHDDLKWNDGCDFQVFSSNPSTVPVKRITNSTAHTSSTDSASFSTNATTDSTHTSTSSGRATYPNWPSTTISAPLTTTVRYWGGAFVIDDQDAVVVRRLIRGSSSGGLVAQDAVTGGNTISFAPFISGSCSYGTTIGGNLNFHVAQVAFTAPTPKILSTKPPRLALLGRNANQKPFDGSGFFFCSSGVGGNDCRGSASRTGRVADTILQNYLERAGLTFTGANGCPINGYLATNHPSLCPSPNKTGQIYDLLDFRDLMGASLASSKLGATSGGEPLYKMFWAPHWEFIGANPNADERQALANIASFANQQAGVMAQCASISAFEGADGSPAMNSFSSTQFQTCTSASCNQISHGLEINTGSINSAGPFSTDALRNCTDPNLSNGQPCAYFAEPGDAFVQIGDYKFNALQSVASTVADFKPASGAKYRSGVKTLVSGVSSLDNTKLGSAATVRTMAGFKGEFVTRNLKDDSSEKSNILYLGTHDETDSIAGTKIALQTLLLLGDPPVVPVNREITRASPVIATINGDVDIVQGTFESIVPAPTTKTATTDAEATSFEFPFLLGHLRGIRANQVAVSGTDFNALPSAAVAFDAATNIPPVTPSGCASYFTGNCRTVFTHTDAGVRPARRMVQTSGTSFTAIKSVIAPGLTTANQTLVVSRVLAGIPDADNPGNYVAKLGGIDRSTAAVIGTSLVAGSPTRPQMIYVGAADGMVHAICAQAIGACPSIGRELWAFIPRTQLSRLRTNTARIDGSPRVIDLFGDFDPTDSVVSRSFRTIMLVPSGSGDPGVAGEQPSVTALDITDPFNPTILWEYVTPTARGVTDFGVAIELTAGLTKASSGNKNLAFVHTNNGGTGTSGSVVSAIDIETGTLLWQTGHQYPAPRVSASGTVPAAGIPGAAIAVDRTGANAFTDVFYGTLYGDLWRLTASTGANPYGANPLFRFTTDKKPFGAAPAIFSDNPANPQSLFVAAVSGGYFDPAALTLWSGDQHQIVAMSANTAVGNTPLNESSASLLKFIKNLNAGERGFAQPTVVGDQLFVTSDTTDVNAAAFGQSSDTGHLYRLDLSNGGNMSTVVINGGAGSIAHSGTELYAASGTQVERLATNANGATAAAISSNKDKLERRLWLQSM